MKTVATVLVTALSVFALACGGYSSHSTPAAGTMPNVAALVPNNANAGSASMVITVNGTNFNSNAAINWRGAALTTTYVSGNQLMATIPAADLTTSGTAAVTVTNPGTMGGGMYGGGTSPEASNSMPFTIN